MNTPRIAHQRHGTFGSVAGTVVALTNGIIKPLVGTLASITWLCRGFYASANKMALADKGEEANTVNTLGLDSSAMNITHDDDEQQQYDNDISQAANSASTVTGFTSEVCKQILFEFDKIKNQRVSSHSHQHES
jgi:hypothetical protein